MEPTYVAVLPVKPPAVGKSRLRGLSDEQRRGFAEAFALDTAAACLDAAHVRWVLVVTDDAVLAGRLGRLGCVAIPDGGPGGLNPSLRLAAAECRRRWPDLVPAAVCADLPALRADDLDAALTAAPDGVQAFVADASGAGTTLYRAPHDAFDPQFGAGSREAHLAGGATQVGDDLPRLRLDVDDLSDLRRATELGLGPETSRLADRLEV